MQDWFFKQGRRERLINWLGLDSRINSTLAETWAAMRDYWNAGTSYFARFKITGWKRLLNEFLSEGLTLGMGGLVVSFALAIPALREFDEGKFSSGQYAVKFLDQNGNEIGKRGILHNDSVPLDEIPDSLVKATLATEDRRFFEHWGIDVIGTARALFTNLQANEVVQGGSSITQQVAKNLFLSSERSMQRKIKEAFLALLLESRLSQARDPEALLRPRLHGRRRLRRGGRVAILLRQVGAPDQPGGVGAARGPVQGADQVCAARQPAGLARPHQRRSEQPRASPASIPRARCTTRASTRRRSSRRATPTAPTGSSTGPSRRCSASRRAAASTC